MMGIISFIKKRRRRSLDASRGYVLAERQMIQDLAERMVPRRSEFTRSKLLGVGQDLIEIPKRQLTSVDSRCHSFTTNRGKEIVCHNAKVILAHIDTQSNSGPIACPGTGIDHYGPTAKTARDAEFLQFQTETQRSGMNSITIAGRRGVWSDHTASSFPLGSQN